MDVLKSIVCLIFLLLFCDNSLAEESTFKASVYELKPTVYYECFTSLCDEEKAMKMMMENINKMKEATEEAAKQGAKIIVFAEWAITGDFMIRDFVYPFIQEILEEAKEDQMNLCNEGTNERKSQILKELSCTAREHKIYVVANLVTKIKCNNMTDKNCRDDGWFIYNTNVAFSKQGELVAVYHKYNLYDNEVPNYDRPPKPEAVTFDTEFGKIGILICFDLVFKEPFHSLLKENVKTIAFSTFWVDAPPLYAGIQSHSMTAYRNGINILSSGNAFETGSGIYSADGVHGLFYEGVTANQSRLVVAEVPVSPKRKPYVAYGAFANSSLTPKSPGVFTSYLDTMPFQFLVLKRSGVARICHNAFCCESTYSQSSPASHEMFALGAYAGYHRTNVFYLEVCAIIRCASSNPESCGSPILNSTQQFSHMTLAGTFTTNNVLPSVLLDGVDKMDLAYDRMTVRDDGLMEYKGRPGDEGLICAQLSGRPFYKDRIHVHIAERPQNNGSSVTPTFVCLYFSICFLML